MLLFTLRYDIRCAAAMTDSALLPMFAIFTLRRYTRHDVCHVAMIFALMAPRALYVALLRCYVAASMRLCYGEHMPALRHIAAFVDYSMRCACCVDKALRHAMPRHKQPSLFIFDAVAYAAAIARCYYRRRAPYFHARLMLMLLRACCLPLILLRLMPARFS